MPESRDWDNLDKGNLGIPRANGVVGREHLHVLESVLICPRCEHYGCLRSHRRKIEYLLSVFGILPWRCVDCQKRFYARRVPVRFMLYAHCRHCGNLNLMTIRREKLARELESRVAMWLGARPVRCDDCRNDFAAWRPVRRAKARAEEEENLGQVTVDSRK